MREFDASYLLRVWRDGRGEDAWRASLRDLRSGKTVIFRGLAELAVHIRALDRKRDEDTGC